MNKTGICLSKVSIHFRGRLKEVHSNIIQFNLVPPLGESKMRTDTPLYPYNSDKLVVMFFYSIGAERQTESVMLSELQSATQIGFFVFVLLAAAILCYLRSRNRLRRDGYISCFIDVCIGLFGGGNLSMRHRLERWFFGIFLIANFFLMTFWVDGIFYPRFFIQDRSIKTFDQLAKVNPPIYMSFPLIKNGRIIEELLR